MSTGDGVDRAVRRISSLTFEQRIPIAPGSSLTERVAGRDSGCSGASKPDSIQTDFLRGRIGRMASSIVDDTTRASSGTQQHEHPLNSEFRSEGDIDLTRQSATLAQNTNSQEFARFPLTRDDSGIHQPSSNVGDTQSTTSTIWQQLDRPRNSSETTQEARDNVNETNSQRRTIISATGDAPGSEMGYSSTNQSDNIRSPLNTSIKMERTPSLHSSSSGTKDVDDALSADSPNSRDASASANDPTMTAPHSPRSPVGTRLAEGTEALSASAFGTPSTISTAPSTDEASADGTDSVGLGLDRSTWRLDDAVAASPMLLPRNPIVQSIPATDSAQHGVAQMPSPDATAAASDEHLYHRRSRSWEEQQLRQHGQVWEGSPVTSPYPSPRPRGSHAPGAWEQVALPQSRVASFRNSSAAGTQGTHGFSNIAPAHPDAWHLVPHRHSRGQHGHVDARAVPGYQQGPFVPGQRNTGYAQHPSGAHTPPRSKQPRSPLHTPSRSPSAPSTPVSASASPSSGNPPRSSSEILKTLLRKKACLYEPDTSRAVAFVTWLVGRELALEYGYFSRQQLQSGVHACVAKKIESGTITRTKVNRCMQIILNSCFHYIIPRPDGSEESGDAFRDSFAAAAVDDSRELQFLPTPWNDLAVTKEFVLAASSRETSPENSPRLGSQQSKQASDDSQSKRAVLLCFNENVRSFQDVLRCHNEFIRDTANAANLQLSDKEWRTFFGRDTVKTTTAWGSTGTSAAVTRAEGDPSKLPDALGRMNNDELSRFRTTWCAKRYEHDHDLCAFAHLEVNGGWLRRNPLTHPYRPTICPSIVRVTDKAISPFSFTLNHCEKGELCDFAHSHDEISYHPDQYKRKLCTAGATKGGPCPLGDICPDFHTAQNVPRGKRRASPDRRSHASQRYRHPQGHGTHSTGKAVTTLPPEGAPMLYIHPAPVSDFEKHLGPPGLQSLFRRHSSVVAGFVRHGQRCKCVYSNFGDDWGIGSVETSARVPRGRLPSTPVRNAQ